MVPWCVHVHTKTKGLRLLTTFLLLEGVRLNLAAWLEKLNCGGDIEKQHFFKTKFINKLRSSPVATDTDKANEQHYEVPTQFFKTVIICNTLGLNNYLLRKNE